MASTMVSQSASYQAAARERFSELVGGDTSLRGWVRIAMLAGLPLAILVGSPQRVSLSALIAAAYVAAALFTGKFTRANRLTLAYAGVAGGYILLSWLRAKYFLHLSPYQLSYGTSKAFYFVLIVLPMAVAVAALIDRPEAAWPTASVQVAGGLAVSVITIALLGARFLGEGRYTWQGNLIALGALVAIQPWLIRKFWISAVIGVISVAAIVYAEARQSLAGFLLALALTSAYWGVARYLQFGRGTNRRALKAVIAPYVLLPLFLIGFTGVWIAVTYHPSQLCHCITDRLVSLQSNAGDRDLLIFRGLHLVEESPIIGTGLGSFAGVIPDYLNPTQLYDYPHNVPLEIAAETGLVGFALLLVPLLVGWALLLWRGISRASPAIAAVMMLGTIFFVVANLSGDIPSERGMWIFGIVALKLALDHTPRPALSK